MENIPIQTYFYLFSILFAFQSSLISFKLDLPFHWKLFSYLLGITFIIEIVATAVGYIGGESNYWIYNSFMLIEFLAYNYFFKALLPFKEASWLFTGFYLFFPALWIVSVFFIFGITKWNSYIIIAGSFFTIVCSLLVYYKITISHEIKKLRSIPEFWIATGMLIFYMAVLPYNGLMNFLVKKHLQVAYDLLPVLQFLDTCMYLTFTYGFICQIRNTKKSLSR